MFILAAKGTSENNLDKGGRDGKCSARRKPRGVAGYTSGLQQRIALVSTAELFKLFSLAPLSAGQPETLRQSLLSCLKNHDDCLNAMTA